jgi:hypothetical protein
MAVKSCVGEEELKREKEKAKNCPASVVLLKRKGGWKD